jgi:hypothetical protein
MSLSICLMTADPAPRIAAIVEPLKPLADEVIIAADSRVDEQTLAGYGALADRLFIVEFQGIERHLAWLFAQCDGDWILRLDGDEVPSQAFVRRLPQMLESRGVQQFWVANAWMFPNARSFLGGTPWSGHFANRLVRNDGTLRVRGQLQLQADPVAPLEYVEEPIYHLSLLTNSEQARLDKAVLYEGMRPHVRAPGGGRINEAFYLPELRSALELNPVPDEDRALIARALAPVPVARASTVAHAPAASYVTLREMDHLWEERPIANDAYRARIEPYEPTISLTSGESHSVLLSVSNEGTERWPARLDEKPLIRLGHRWLNVDGSLNTEDTPRSPFARVVIPGERVLTPLEVVAPTHPGDYILEADVLHEGVKWFGCGCRITAHVGQPLDLPPADARLQETPPPRLQRWRAVRIPRTIHRVWLGSASMPVQHERFGETFAKHHPGWQMRLWTDEDLPALDIDADDRASCRTQRELANLARYEILSRFGGVYADTDVECLRPLTPLLRGIDAFAALEQPGRVCNAILGAVPGHPVFGRASRLARRTLGTGAHSVNANGPYFLSLLLEQESGVAIFGAKLFYPYLWDEPERRDESFPDSYAVHHWATGVSPTPAVPGG